MLRDKFGVKLIWIKILVNLSPFLALAGADLSNKNQPREPSEREPNDKFPQLQGNSLCILGLNINSPTWSFCGIFL
jgi:hypothetical protein